MWHATDDADKTEDTGSVYTKCPIVRVVFSSAPSVPSAQKCRFSGSVQSKFLESATKMSITNSSKSKFHEIMCQLTAANNRCFIQDCDNHNSNSTITAIEKLINTDNQT